MKTAKSSVKSTALNLCTAVILAGIATGMDINTAEARPSTQAFTCAGVQNFVEDRGAVVMNTTKSWVYRRFVADRSYCDRGESTVRYSVPTQSGRCGLRICKEIDFFRRK